MARQFKIDAEVFVRGPGVERDVKVNMSVLLWDDTQVVLAYLPHDGKRFVLLADKDDDAFSVVQQFAPMLADFFGTPEDGLSFSVIG